MLSVRFRSAVTVLGLLLVGGSAVGCRSARTTATMTDLEPIAKPPRTAEAAPGESTTEAARVSMKPASRRKPAEETSKPGSGIQLVSLIQDEEGTDASDPDALRLPDPEPSEGRAEDDANESPPEDIGVDEKANRRDARQGIDVEDFTDPEFDALQLEAVIESVYRTYPLLRASLTERQRTAGQQLAAFGAFDHQLSGFSENQPVSFYENYRHQIGLARNIRQGGGAWFAEYQLGRGEFEPWYKEREKNEGGEFRLGILRPLRAGRAIDDNRAALWKAAYQRQQAEPAIRAELIDYVMSASVAYWNWVAAGQRYELASELLRVTEIRNDQIRRRVEEGDLPPPTLSESERLVLSRRGILLAAEQVLEQSIARLSAFYRSPEGIPIRLDEAARVGFQPPNRSGLSVESDLPTAIENRPELEALLAERRIQQVTLANASNQLMPRLDAAAEVRQDVGGPTPSDDKQPLELQASIYLDVPLQRRQAKGRILQANADIAATTARLQLAEDQVRIDLDVAAAAIEAASDRLEAARESVELAKELVRVERRRFELGDASLLEVTLREQQLLESSTDLITAHFDEHVGEAMYRAALGIDRLPPPGNGPFPLKTICLPEPPLWPGCPPDAP